MTEISSPLAEALGDRYRIEQRIGEGGMAIVYRAQDVRHNRPVAIKVLRPELAAILGADRFLKEIEVTANLQHPNILQLYDSGTAGRPDHGVEFLYYVMPYVEGETLRDKLDREKQLGVDETVEIAKGVAGALDYAHRQDVIHRDIKPENIMLIDGQPLVADFGIALAVSQAGGTRLTETGLSIGTPHYMSPEQAAADRQLDGRSDVYSLGAVVYEMLVGQPPFVAASVQAIMSKILTEQPTPVSDERPAVPANVNAAVLAALTKLPADRFATGGQFVEALANPAFTTTVAGTIDAAPDARVWKYATFGASALAALFAIAFALSTTRPMPTAPVTRYVIAFPDSQRLLTTSGSSATLSPDGSKLVYVGPTPGGGGMQLWVRERDAFESTPIPDTEEAYQPFFGPFNDRVAFLTNLRDVRIVSLAGEPPVVVVDSVYRSYGGDWGPDGYVYASHFNRIHRGVIRVPEAGGDTEIVTTVDTAGGESSHGRPHALPSAGGAVFTIRYGANRANHEIGVVDFSTGEHRALMRGVIARFVPTGHLVVVQDDGSLLAVPFDEEHLELRGAPVPLQSDVAAGPAFAISTSGRLVYSSIRHGWSSTSNAEVVWVDRNGTVSPLEPAWMITRAFTGGPSLSPDGTRLAVTIRRVTAEGLRRDDIWLRPIAGGVPTRLTLEQGIRPEWAPDGRSVAYTRLTDTVFAKRTDGTGGEEVLFVGSFGSPIEEVVWTPDGEMLVVRTGDDRIWLVRPGSSDAPIQLAAAQEVTSAPAVSPDGRWMAYQAYDEGEQNVWVRPFPGTAEEIRWQVSADGGRQPAWSPNSRQLFYFDPTGQLMAVSFTTDPAFFVTEREVLFTAPLGSRPTYSEHRMYDVGTDGQRFLTLRDPRSSGRIELAVVENFFEELKAKVGSD